MADYRAQTLTGDKWTRAYRVVIENPHVGIPSITFSEEDITVLSNGLQTNHPVSNVSMKFTDPSALVQLRDPVTGNLIPGAFMSHGQIYAALYSLYISAAEARDAA